MKTSQFKSIFPALVIAVLSLVTATPAIAQFQKLFGNSADNFFNKIIPDGSNFYVLGIDGDKATITRVSGLGQQLWTQKLFVSSGLVDAAIIPGSGGNLIFVGFTLPFNNTNQSIIGRITPTGTFLGISTYDVPGSEAFTDIEYKPASNTFAVLGFQNLNLPNNDVVLLDVALNGAINSKQIYPGAGDDNFDQDLEVLPNGDLVMSGYASTNGVIYQINSTGNLVGGVIEFSPFLFEDLAQTSNGDFLAVGRPFSSGLPRLSRFDNSWIPVWEVTIAGLNDVDQVLEAANGDIYAVGTGNFGGVDRAVVMKIQDSGGVPTLLWTRYIQNGATAYTGGSIALLSGNKIAFADGREGNQNSLGLSDAFLAVTNADLATPCTLDTTVAFIPFTSVYASPDGPGFTPYDPPPGQNIDFQNAGWQQAWACALPIPPQMLCGDIHVLVEPEQDGRTVGYYGITAEGDNVTLDFAPPEGTVFPVGVSTVVATATDASGGTATCSFAVTVEKMPYDSLQPPPELTPEGSFDRLRDRFGNPYRLADLQIQPDSSTRASLCLNSGYFNLYFEPGCGMDGSSALEVSRRDVLCQLFSDLSQFIVPANPAVRVNIWIRDMSKIQGMPNPSTSGVLGAASPFYTMPYGGAFGKGGLEEGEVWKTINSGVDSYTGLASPLAAVNGGGGNLGYYHAEMAFNFVNPYFHWHTDLASPPGFSFFDLYSVALHEALHTLGIVSMIDANGLSKFSAPFYFYYTSFDSHLRAPANMGSLPLLTNTGSCSQYDYKFNPTYSQPSAITQPYFGGGCNLDHTDCVNAVTFVGANVTQNVFTPNCFSSGSTFSHLEDECHAPNPLPNNSYYVTSNGVFTGAMKRYPKGEERLVLCDLGYKVTASYGNPGQFTDTTYSGGICPGLGVAGVNDGIAPGGIFVYQTSVGVSTAPISNILANDFNAVSFECLEVVLGGGSVSATAGTSFVYTPTSSPGTTLLRYIPVSPSGKRGNITYIFVRVNPLGCPATLCNLVSNGGFEIATGCGYFGNAGASATLACWNKFSSIPSLLSRSCSNSYHAVATLYNPETWSGTPNNHYVRLYGQRTSATVENCESIQTNLSTPITAGTYTVSFWAWGWGGGAPCYVLLAGSPNSLAPIGAALTPALSSLVTLKSGIPVGNGWIYTSTTFTYSGTTPLNNLIVANYPTSFSNTNSYFFIDDIKVSPQTVTFTPPSPVCQTAPLVNLNASVNLPGGVFTATCGSCVANNGGNYTFDPSLAALGAHIITYTVTDANGCTQTTTALIQVATGPVVLFASPIPRCLNAPLLSLNPLATPAGGLFSGPGVSCAGTVCDFNAAVAGVGTHSITYTYTGGACPASATVTIQVNSCIDTCEITNRCIDLDGINDFVDVPNPLNSSSLQNNFTIACWFHDDSPVGAPDGIFHRLFGFAWTGPRFEVGDQDGFLTFFGGNLVASTVNVRDGAWHHLAAVKNGNLVTIYLDCAAVPGLTNLNVGTFAGATQHFHIGDWAGGGLIPRFWQGQIDEFKVWGAVLSASQICDEKFCSLDPNNLNLLVHFPFDQFTAYGNNAGNNLADNVVAGAADGLLTNFTLTGNHSNWVGRGRDRLPNCNPDYFAWLDGNNRRNFSGRSKVYDGDLFTAGSETVNGVEYPVFTRRGPDGRVIWRTMINTQAAVNDFVRTDEGCYLLVGHLPIFKYDNRSFIARISPNGNLDWLYKYDLGYRESFLRIIRSDNPSNPLYPYVVCGLKNTPTNSNHDMLLFTLDNQGNIDWLRQIGDVFGLPTNDNAVYDLMNYQGGYLLTGFFDINITPYPVLFRTDNQGFQIAGSTLYQPNITFYDTEPAATGTDLIVAGQLNSGVAIVARVTATGAPVWAKTFPNLKIFRRIVVRPNGDIFLIGQRNFVVAYHNVVVKIRDVPGGPVVSWQKHAEQPGEINWTPADLAWYSGGMFFYTDGRLSNPNTFGNEDIGAVLYPLDLATDICPFTKDPSVLSQNFTLVQAPMQTLLNLNVVPPAPTTGALASSLNVLYDSLCSYVCTCKFANLAFRKNFPLPVWNVPVTDCGQAPVTLPGCPGQYTPIKFSGQLKCAGGCVFSGLSWKLINPNNVVTTGTSSSSNFTINLTLTLLQVQGTYTIELTGLCGTDTCFCTVQFKVPACPVPCDCVQPAFSNAVNGGFNWLLLPNCNIRITPKYLSSCDLVTWTRNGTPFGSVTTGNQPATTAYSSGTTVICMTVTRTPSGGGAPCTASYCKSFILNCNNLDGGPSEGNALRSDACDNSGVQNNGFVWGAEAGGMTDIGKVDSWNSSGGNPEVVLEAGHLDTNLVRLRGNGGYADLLYQDSLPLTAWDSVELSLSLRPIHELLLPGTELVVRLSAQRQDSLWCNDDSTCLELMRLPIPQLDTSVWLVGGTSGIVKTQALPFLTIHVENPFIADDVALQSVMDVDNVCLSQYDIVATKQPETTASGLRLFPNPTTGELNVDWTGAAPRDALLLIINLSGQVLRAIAVPETATSLRTSIGDLPAGMYFVKIRSANRLFAVGKVVKE